MSKRSYLCMHLLQNEHIPVDRASDSPVHGKRKSSPRQMGICLYPLRTSEAMGQVGACSSCTLRFFLRILLLVVMVFILLGSEVRRIVVGRCLRIISTVSTIQSL